jgi:hypothetical protein
VLIVTLLPGFPTEPFKPFISGLINLALGLDEYYVGAQTSDFGPPAEDEVATWSLIYLTYAGDNCYDKDFNNLVDGMGIDRSIRR